MSRFRRGRRSQPVRTMVRCGDHKWAPARVVCVHPANGTSTDWRPVNEVDRAKGGRGFGPRCEHDYLCPACAERFPHLSVDDLATLCMHCVRKLRALTSDPSQAQS
jgi:hypothetical protein